MAEINELIKKNFELKKEIDRLSEEHEATKAEIKLRLSEENLREYEDPFGNYVTYKEQTRESLDKNRIRELIGELQFKEVVRETTFETLRIVTKEQREENKNRFKRLKE
jgi:hypothetical protein